MRTTICCILLVLVVFQGTRTVDVQPSSWLRTTCALTTLPLLTVFFQLASKSTRFVELSQEDNEWVYSPSAAVNLSGAMQQKNYSCPTHPSNFSWHPVPRPLELSFSNFENKSFSFIGGSTTRQLYEQLKWEFPKVRASYAGGNFLFDWQRLNGQCCKYDGSHLLDLRNLEAGVLRAIRSSDYVIVNVGTWWNSNTIGIVVDEDGTHWNVTTRGDWKLRDSNTRIRSKPPSLRFEDLMRKALRLMLAKAAPGTVIVWRSETFTQCPPGTGERSGVGATLRELRIPIINITKKTCAYGRMFPKQRLGPHLCFPSVALRYWLQEFQKLMSELD